MMNKRGVTEEFQNLYKTIIHLRSDEGCPWDRAQSPQSLTQHLIEESYELIDAINNNDISNIEEEIGDLYLVITMIASIFEEKGDFTLSDSLKDINNKIIRRHPHVFGDAKSQSPQESLAIWQEQKIAEGKNKPLSFDRLGRGLPPLEKAVKIEKKMIKIGYSFDNNMEKALAKVDEELNELKIEIRAGDHQKSVDEMGDLFLTLVMLCEQAGINPGDAIHGANNKVIRRMNFVEQSLNEEGLPLEPVYTSKMEEAWQKAKEMGL